MNRFLARTSGALRAAPAHARTAMRAPETRAYLAALRPVAREGLFFFGIALALLSLDSTHVLWSLWWPMPLLTLACIGMLIAERPPQPGLRAVAGWLGVALLAALDAALCMMGPLAAEGQREAQSVALTLMCAGALWLRAASKPRAALAHAAGAMALAWLTARLAAHGSDGMAVQFSGAASYGWGAIFAGGWWAALHFGITASAYAPPPRGAPLSLRSRSRPQHGPGDEAGFNESEPASSRLQQLDYAMHYFRPLWLLFLAGGLLAGRAMLRADAAAHTLRAAPDDLLQIAGLRAQSEVWFRSLLFGWGELARLRLTPLYAEAPNAIAPAWGGPAAFFARYGVAGFLVLIAWTLLALRRPRPRAAPHEIALEGEAASDPHGPRRASLPSPLRPLGVALSLFLFGFMLAGGPKGFAPAMALAIAAAFACAPRLRAPQPPGSAIAAPRRVPWASLAATLLAGILLSAWMGRPMLGTTLARRAVPGSMPRVHLQERLLLAQRLNPADPSIATALASAKRDEMNATRGWSESLYQAAVRHYRAARHIDPFDPIAAIREAQFELLCDREDEAFATMKAAREALPRSSDLLDWTIATAIARNRTTLAMETLEYALSLDPAHGEWWQDYCVLARRLGQGPAAARSLAFSLTAAPDDPSRVALAWDSTHPK